jgi:hypothetical protein
MKEKKWFCLNCKKFVDVHVLGYGASFNVCKECWSNRVIELKEMGKKEFKEFVKKFKERTDRKLKKSIS